MSRRSTELISNISKIQQSIAACQTARAVKLLPVSKYKPAQDIEILYQQAHIKEFAENYTQELLTKASQLPKDIRWHYIGTLQTNKCKDLAHLENLHCIQTIDSIKKIEKLNFFREKLEFDAIEIFIQVNTSGESNKSGVGHEELTEIVQFVADNSATLSKIKLVGLMTIGSVEQSFSSDANEDFLKLKKYRDELDQKFGFNLKLSMGMSNDYLKAIEYGSDLVRIGSNIFGARDYS